MDAEDSSSRLDQLEIRLAEIVSRLRRVEARLSDGAINVSNTQGQTKPVKLSDDGTSLEVVE